jgi:hypothetical protein
VPLALVDDPEDRAGLAVEQCLVCVQTVRGSQELFGLCGKSCEMLKLSLLSFGPFRRMLVSMAAVVISDRKRKGGGNLLRPE